MVNKLIVGILIMTILASGIMYVELTDKVRIRIDDDKSSLYVPHDTYDWIWVVGGREYNRLFDGTARLNRDLSRIIINQTIIGDTVIISRSTGFKRGPMIIDTYTFKSIDTVELFPISHNVEIYNASGYFYRYTVDELTGVPVKRKLIDETTLSFGRNIKVELHPNYRWAWIGWPYGSDSISAQYDIVSDYEVFNVRLFDPTSNVTLYFDHVNASLDIEQGTKINITANSSLNQEICLSADHGSIGDDYICANYSVSLLWAAESNIRKLNDSDLYELVTFTGSGSQNITLYDIRNRSEIEYATVDIAGIDGTNLTKNVRLDFDADGTYEWSTWGDLYSATVNTTEFNNSNVNQTVTYTGAGTNSSVLRLSKDLTIDSAILNISGETNDYFSNDYTLLPFENDSGGSYLIYAPTTAYDGTNIFMFGFTCSRPACEGKDADIATKYTIGGGIGSMDLVTDVPWYVFHGGAVYKSGADSGIYVFGGWNGSDYASVSDNMYHYNPSTDAWTAQTSMPSKRLGHEYVLVDNDDKIYICGGHDETSVYNKSCFSYDISADTYATLADLPDGMELGWAEQLNSTHLLFYGGTRRGSASGGRTYMYEIATDTWSTMTSLPEYFYGNAGASIDGNVYSFGGWYDSKAWNVAYRYDEALDDWVNLQYNMTGINYYGNTVNVTFLFDECSEVDDYMVCVGSGGFGVGGHEYQMYLYPKDVSVTVGDYATTSQTFSGTLSTADEIDDISTELNDQLSSCTEDEGYCYINLIYSNQGAGNIISQNLDIIANLSTVSFGEHNVSCSSTDCEIPIMITQDNNGSLNITDINVSYLGTSVINWSATMDSETDSYNMSIYYSDWDYTIANDYDYIEFIPDTPTSANVTPYGQTSTRGIMNITTANYGGKNMSWYMKVNETHSCVNLTLWNTSTKDDGFASDGSSWYELADNVNYSTVIPIHIWADYGCSYSTWKLWEPTFYFRGCCEGCTCSEDVS